MLHSEQVGIQFAVLYKPYFWKLPFIHHMSTSMNSDSWYKKPLCVIQFKVPYVHFSIHYSSQSVTAMQRNRKPASQTLACPPDHVIILSKMFLTLKSIKNLTTSTPTQINAWKIAKAAIIIRQMGKKFAVIKPSIWIVCHGSNSQQLQILVATTYVNNRTA